MNQNNIVKEQPKKVLTKQEEEEKILSRLIRKPKTRGQKASDFMTKWVGSWTFIISLFVFMAFWMSLNIYMVVFKWDPYPFILLNFVLSCLAAIQAPIILMSQNRQEHRDRYKAEMDFRINKKAEREIEDMQKDFEEVKKLIREIAQKIK